MKYESVNFQDDQFTLENITVSKSTNNRKERQENLKWIGAMMVLFLNNKEITVHYLHNKQQNSKSITRLHNVGELVTLFDESVITHVTL